ncbi:hypothetical protein PAXRUDRAFT_169129, partial [Paxillus rubicundulus Ve08.2h10]
EHLMKYWVSPVYAFFDLTPKIVDTGGRRTHEFKCSAWGCKVTVWRYLDKKDVKLMSNMCKHVKGCWGDEVLNAADDAKDADKVWSKIVGGILRNGSITAMFEWKGKGKVTYSHRQHTQAETNLRPFEIVKDLGFQHLMKTGRPEYYLLHPTTISCDMRLVFARTRQRIAKMLRGYEGKISFTTNAWTSLNHKAFVAFSVHLEHNGMPLSMPLDIIEVVKVKDYLR